MRIVGDRFSAELIARFGVARLWLLLRYLERAPEIPGPLDVLAILIRTTSSEGDTYLIPFAEARLDELERAIALLDVHTDGRLTHLPEGAEELRHAVLERLQARLGGETPRVRVGYRTVGTAHRIQLDIEGVFADRLADVARAFGDTAKTKVARTLSSGGTGRGPARGARTVGNRSRTSTRRQNVAEERPSSSPSGSERQAKNATAKTSRSKTSRTSKAKRSKTSRTKAKRSKASRTSTTKRSKTSRSSTTKRRK